MLKIALTGNIASGKSEVEKYLANKGFKTICLDIITKEIYESDLEFKNILTETFGTSKKEEISKFIFKDNKKLKTLENIIYPRIKDKMLDFFDKNKDEKIVIVAAPMLFESRFDVYFDKIIFVSSEKNIRLNRLIKRNNLSIKEAILRINSQLSEEKKIPKSDYIIKNNSSIDELYIECNKLTEELSIL